MTSEPLNIALTFDAEMDAFDTSIASPSSLEWRGIEQGIPLIDDVLAEHHDSLGKRACATWFVRCDDQIESMTGNRAYLLDRYRDLWLGLQELGDEIAFHPHLYYERGGKWKQDKNPGSLREQILRSIESMRKSGFETVVSRIGEAFSSNAVMLALEEAGIRYDSTAMPGRVREDGERSLNWGPTPTYAYHPDENDYRVQGNDARNILEIPMSMLMTLADYDSTPFMRYLDLSFHPRALQIGFTHLVSHADTIVTVSHPSTILSEDTPHGLLSFNLAAFRGNLRSLINECTKQKRPIRFVTLDTLGRSSQLGNNNQTQSDAKNESGEPSTKPIKNVQK